MFFRYWNKDGQETKEEAEIDEKSGLFVRPSTVDKKMIRQCWKHYRHLKVGPGSRVVDLGANIGGFCKMAFDAGAASITAFEPDPLNFEVLTANCGSYCNLVQAAIVSDLFEGDEVKFLIRKNSKNSACSGQINRHGIESKNYVEFSVPAVRFSSLKDLQPDVLKIDIEGAEYGFIEGEIPESIRQMAGELHGMRKDEMVKMRDTWEKISSEWSVDYYEEERIFGSDVRLINFVVHR